MTDTEARRRGERSRLDTGVVHAVNDAVFPFGKWKNDLLVYACTCYIGHTFFGEKIYWMTHNSNIFLLIASICVSSTILIMFFDYSLTQTMFRASVLLVFALSYNPWLHKHFTEYKEAVKVEKHHWKHDKDLQRIQKIRYAKIEMPHASDGTVFSKSWKIVSCPW